METALPGKGSRSDLPSELGFALAPRETDPTPVVTRSSEVSRVEPTSAMVTRSRAGRPWNRQRSRNRIPTGDRNATGTGTMSAICEGGLAATAPSISDTASQYM